MQKQMEQEDPLQDLMQAASNKRKYAATYGLYLGLYLVVFYFLSVFFSKNALIHILCSLGNLGMFVYAYHLIKTYRERSCKGVITLGQAWSFGVWMFIFMALIMSVAHYIHFQFIQPEFIAQQYNQALLALEEMKYPSNEIDLLVANGIPSSIQMTFVFIWFYVLGGAFLSLIYAFFIRKQPVL